MSESITILAPVFAAEATMSGNNIGMIVGIGGLLLFGLVVIVGCFVMAELNSRKEARRAEREVELKKHMLDRGLSADEIERLIRVTAEPRTQPAKINDEEVDALSEIGGLFGWCEDAKPEAIEEVLAIARTADPKMRRAMVNAVEQIRDTSGALTDEQIRAVVRALAHPAEPSTQAKTSVEDLPRLTGTASRRSDAFHLPE